MYIASIEDPSLLGLNFLVENKCKIDLEHNVMIISGDSVEASLSKYPNGEPLRLARVMNVHKEVIPPRTVTRIDAHFDKFKDKSEFDDLVVEALQLEDSDSRVVINTLVANNGRCFLNIINIADHNVKLNIMSRTVLLIDYEDVFAKLN